jgi:hypothetical protein
MLERVTSRLFSSAVLATPAIKHANGDSAADITSAFSLLVYFASGATRFPDLFPESVALVSERRDMLPAASVAAVLLCLAAQVAGSQSILENDQMRLELIGLKRWTVPMIQDSLRRYAPNDSLLSHACAGILREKLRFADASVMYYTTNSGEQTKPYVAVTVVEPQDSALIRYRGPFRDSLRARRAWEPVRAVFEHHNEAFQGSIQRPKFLLSDAPLRDVDSTVRLAMPLRRFLRAHRASRDRQLALAALAADGNEQNRVAAVLILANFASEDSAWWALAEALRDPSVAVHNTAAQLLSTLRRDAPRHVNWAPATETVRAILDGTNLFAHNELMEVLAATEVDRALARPLLKDGGYIVLAKLQSQGTLERQAARRFLMRLACRPRVVGGPRWPTFPTSTWWCRQVARRPNPTSRPGGTWTPPPTAP